MFINLFDRIELISLLVMGSIVNCELYVILLKELVSWKRFRISDHTSDHKIHQQPGNAVGNDERSQNFVNFCSLTAKNRTVIFTHHPKILYFSSLLGFADGDQQTELNQTLPNGGW